MKILKTCMRIEIFIVLCLLNFPVYAESEKPYDPSRDAYTDYQNALIQSKNEHKNLFISIGGNWCVYCLKFNEDLKNSNCYKIIKEKYVYLKVNYSEENKNEEFFNLFPKINGYPYFIIVSAKGEILEHSLVMKVKLEDDFYNMLISHII